MSNRKILTLCTVLILATFARSDEPKELSDLKLSWNKARKLATDPIDKKYIDTLQAMKVRFTKAGNLDSALAIDAELKAVLSDSTSKSSPKPDDDTDWLKRVLDTKWMLIPAEQRSVVFKADGVATRRNASDAEFDSSYKVVDKRKLNLWGEYTLEFDRDYKSATMVKTTGDWKTTVYPVKPK